MNDILFFIALSIFGICIISLLLYWKITSRRRNKCNACRARLDEASSNIIKLDTLIDTCVGSINQKMVSHLKKENSFAQSDKEEAFNECRKMIYSVSSSNELEELSYLGINMDAWINTRIEYFVRRQRSKQS